MPIEPFPDICRFTQASTSGLSRGRLAKKRHDRSSLCL
jgi:hypothetical protein